MQQALQIAIQHHQAGRLLEAIAAYRQAMIFDPKNGDIVYALGLAMHTTGDLGSAIACFRQAIALKPNFPEALSSLGGTLQQIGDFEQAILSLEQAIRLRPEMPEAHLNLSNALSTTGRIQQSIAAVHTALRLRPNWPIAYNNLGIAHERNGDFDPAIEAFRKAITIDPSYADAHYNLGNALGNNGEADASIAAYRAAQNLRPDWAMNNSNLLFVLHFSPQSTSESIYNEHKRWNEQHALPLLPQKPVHLNDRSSHRRLRIGYVAPDFYDHCQSFFTIPLFSNHDHEQFEIFCYADVGKRDSVTARIKTHIDVWRSTVGMSDEQLTGLIKSDRIDILVDLTMHMRFGRTFVFARKPAPVQIAWLAYPSTTGLTAIDYRLADPFLDPPGLNDAFYSEESIRLPHTFWCYDPLTDIPVNPLPADSTKCITFGCLSNFLKINPGVLKLWSSVLQEVPESRMIILAPQGSARQRVIDGLKVEPRRIEFVERQPRELYLKTFHRIDMGLDTFPYNGHTTTLDAFWMGVPVVTLCGQTAVSRAGFSQCSNLGLTELVAHDPENFVRIAKELASDRPRLRELRSTLRQRMKASPLMDGKRFARDVEDVYRDLWRRWCEKH